MTSWHNDLLADGMLYLNVGGAGVVVSQLSDTLLQFIVYPLFCACASPVGDRSLTTMSMSRRRIGSQR